VEAPKCRVRTVFSKTGGLVVTALIFQRVHDDHCVHKCSKRLSCRRRQAVELLQCRTVQFPLVHRDDLEVQR